MSTKTEKRSAEETLKRLKMGGILAVGIIVAMVIVGIVCGNASAKRVDAKYQETLAKYQTQIDDLEDKLSNPIASYEDTASTEVVLSQVDLQVKEIGELTTMEYLYTDVGMFADPKKIFGKNIPFTTKSFISKWDGIIKAGIDFTKVTIQVDESTNVLIIGIPEAEILSHEVDENSVETLNQTDGLFNPVKVEDVRSFDAESKAAMEKRAIENDLLIKAYDNAKRVISTLVNAVPGVKETYTIQFEDLT